MTMEIVGYLERPELRESSRLYEVWPQFLLHDRTINVNFDKLFDDAPEFQFYALEGDVLVAQANALPVAWDGVPQPRRRDLDRDPAGRRDRVRGLLVVEVDLLVRGTAAEDLD